MKKYNSVNIKHDINLFGELLEQMDDFHSSGRGTMKRKELPVGINKNNNREVFLDYA